MIKKYLLLSLGAPYQNLSQNLKKFLHDNSLEIFNKMQ
ncbi:SLEI domain protein, PF07620 family [Leptospira interrogans str. 2006001854]|uniref:SLEI domain protein, PF07620 family n=1 Tax=Leptospira interrogans str. 2006001854 TaxID=1001590 RepID=M6GFF0_LEPIR|nr:SLEI domain protein, PF07620 family [Leptospira interrogans str. 2006001854]